MLLSISSSRSSFSDDSGSVWSGDHRLVLLHRMLSLRLLRHLWQLFLFIVPTQTTETTPDIKTEEDSEPTPVSPSETPETPAPVVANTTVDPNLPKKISETMNHYSNSNFRYEFDIPANVYYSWFGGEKGARHTVGIGKEDPETLNDAAVRVYFYGKKVVPELQNATNNKYEDPAGAYVYLLLDGAYSVKIEALNINHPIVQKIIETIKVF
jgi:hypothetical protein